ncbi:MAG TPA: hypothetical protein VEP49_00175 [Acidimicrobiia bacterium]|nr:hypothetical protein [Acidimicrobiia bacterium]
MKVNIRLGAAIAAMALASATLVSVSASQASAGGSIPTNDPGIGSPEALAGPKCDPATKRVKLQSYAAPLCVKPWKDGADNGGATAQGVTAKTIKVAVLYGDLPPNQLATKGLYVNQATGENSPTAPVDSTKDINEIYKYAYETWGRTVEFTFVKSTGSDEAAQRSDAVGVAALKPFAVLDEATSINTPPVGGGAVFEQALKNAGVPLVISTGASDPKLLSRSYSLPTAEFIGKQLKGGKAVYADKSMQNQPRKFGVLFPDNFDIDYFKAQLAKWGVKLTSEASYSVPPGDVSLQTSSPEIDQQIAPLIVRLKAAGVNNLIMMTSHATATTATNAMKAQSWFPEITATAFPYTDLDLLARAFDQDVWSHAFGLIWFLPGVQGNVPNPSVATFDWFWGTDKGTRWDGANALLGILYSDIMFAGPDLSKQTVALIADRLRKANAGVGGAYSNSAFTFESPPPPPTGGTPIRGQALGWWNSKAEGTGNYNLGVEGKGEYEYLDQGKRYVAGTFPTAKKKFFDTKNSTAVFPALPASEPKWPTYTCENCPSTGNTSIVPAAAQA